MKIRTAVAAALLGAIGVMPVAAQASPLPFSDPNSLGAIGLCDAAGHQITSGKINAAPFVAKAVSSVAAPPAYAKKGAKATLYAFQPRQGVPAGEWNGYEMTGSTAYSTSGRPTAITTHTDPPLLWPLQAYPARLDNLYQLRMFFSIEGRPTWTYNYPTAVIQVEGNTWHQVNPVTLSCNTGAAVSDEQVLLPPSKVNASVSAPPASVSAPASAVANGVSAAPTEAATAGVTPDASSTSSSSSGPSTSSLVILGLAVLLFAGAALMFWRTRAKHGASAS